MPRLTLQLVCGVTTTRVLHIDMLILCNAAQTDKLQALIRSYIAQRLVPSKPAAEPNDIAAAGDVDTSEPPSLKGPDDIPQDAGEGLRQVVEEMGIPLPDGAGGLCLPPPADDESEAEAVEEVEGRREFPRAEAVGEATSTLKQPDPSLRNSHPYDTLPDIGRLAREIVRNGEEKLAVAVGAYNSVSSAIDIQWFMADKIRSTGISERLTLHYLRKKRRSSSVYGPPLFLPPL